MSGSRAPADPLTGTHHELLVARLLTAGNGLLAFTASIGVVTVVVQPHQAAYPVLFQFALLAVYAAAVVAAVVALWGGRRVIKNLNGVVAIGFLILAACAWPVLAITGTTPSGQVMWLLTVMSVPVLAAVIAWGQTGGWIVLGTLAVFLPLLRFAMGDISPNAVTNDVQAFGTAVLLCALAGTTLGRARRADSAARAAREAGAREAESSARRDVEARAQALVHDEVLATLGFAARATPGMLSALAAQARGAWQALHALSIPASQATDARDFRAGLQELARAHGAEFGEQVGDGAALAEIPPDVSAAVHGAAHQALVNSRQHAPDSTLSLILRTGGDGIRIEVRDDGPGFNPDTVPHGRLGIAVSILARMRAVGGRAAVRSAPGQGAVVELRWMAHQIPQFVEQPARTRLLGDGEMRLVGMLLAGGQILLGLYSLTWLQQPIPSLIAGAALAAAFMIIGWSAARASGRTVITTVLLALVAVGMLWLTDAVATGAPVAPTYAGMWPFIGAALVLGMLCLRGWPATAALVLLPLIAIAILAVAPGPFDEIRAAMARSVVIVASGAALAVSIRVLDDRVERARAVELRASTERAWLAEVTSLAHEKVTTWDATVAPLLLRIAEGTGLSPDETRQCLELEGAFRDGYRAGRLDAPGVAAAAARARARGVDVVLVDDVPGRAIDEEQLVRLRGWLVGELDRATGTFIGRIQPVGRSVLATASSDAAATDFGG